MLCARLYCASKTVSSLTVGLLPRIIPALAQVGLPHDLDCEEASSLVDQSIKFPVKTISLRWRFLGCLHRAWAWARPLPQAVLTLRFVRRSWARWFGRLLPLALAVPPATSYWLLSGP